MLQRLRNRITYANVVGTLALFMALGGTSYAAVTITGRNIKDNTVTSADIKNRSLQAVDFKLGQLPAGRQGLPGPRGPVGPTGAPGPQGPAGTAANVRIVTADGAAVAVAPATANVVASVNCPPGMFAVGGGGFTLNGNAVLTDSFQDSAAPAPATAWTVVYRNDTAAADTVNATVTCAAT
jgi:hypothetical protein